MSNPRIRRLFFEELKNGLKQPPSNKLRWPLYQHGIWGIKPKNETHINCHLIPAPAESETLQGDHVRYMGIYQMDVKVMLPTSETQVVDTNIILDEITDKIQSIFKINMLLKSLDPEDTFFVQVLSPLKVMEASRAEGNWWVARCYLNYRADTNI